MQTFLLNVHVMSAGIKIIIIIRVVHVSALAVVANVSSGQARYKNRGWLDIYEFVLLVTFVASKVTMPIKLQTTPLYHCEHTANHLVNSLLDNNKA